MDRPKSNSLVQGLLGWLKGNIEGKICNQNESHSITSLKVLDSFVRVFNKFWVEKI